jgi:hypothetical protein
MKAKCADLVDFTDLVRGEAGVGVSMQLCACRTWGPMHKLIFHGVWVNSGQMHNNMIS